MRPDVYTPSFRRGLFKYVNNGFFARDLDADDIAFLEHIRNDRHVSSGGWDGNGGVFLLDELDWWHLPYGVDHSAHRRYGTRAERRAREQVTNPEPSAWHEARKRNLIDRAIEAAELENERRAWKAKQIRYEKEREERLKKTMQADLEWEAANPRKAQTNGRGVVSEDTRPSWQIAAEYYERRKRKRIELRNGRFYVPQWKKEEEEAKSAAERAGQQRREEEAEQRRQAQIDGWIAEAERAAEAKAEAEAKAKAKAEAKAAENDAALAEAQAEMAIPVPPEQWQPMAMSRARLDAERAARAAHPFGRAVAWTPWIRHR